MPDTKLHLENGSVVMLSDAHLKRPKGRSYRYLCEFLANLDGKVKTLVIAGDLFDFWIGDLKVQEKRFERLLEILQQISRRGIKIVYCEGNHDFALGERLKQRLDLEVTENDAQLRLGAMAIYVSHGDLINPADIGYRILRRILRSSIVRFLARVLPERLVLWVAHHLSRSSRSYTNTRGDNSRPGLYVEFAEKLVSKGYDLVVVGHTHVAEKFAVHSGGRHGVFINLGEWMFQYTYLRLEPDGTAVFTRYVGPDVPEDEATAAAEDTMEFTLG